MRTEFNYFGILTVALEDHLNENLRSTVFYASETNCSIRCESVKFLLLITRLEKDEISFCTLLIWLKPIFYCNYGILVSKQFCKSTILCWNSKEIQDEQTFLSKFIDITL